MYHDVVEHDAIEEDVWHMSHDMVDKKYFDTFCMSFLAFEQLVLELTPFLQSDAPYFVWSPILVCKQVKLILY